MANDSGSVSYIIQAINQFTPVANQVKRSVEEVTAKVEKTQHRMARFSQTFKDFSSQIEKVGKKISLKVGAPLLALGGFALHAAGKVEQLQVAFTSMLGSADEATKVIDQIKKFSLTGTFKFTDVTAGARQLLAVQVPTKDLTSTLSNLGDIAAFASVPLEEIVNIYARVKAAGRVNSQDLRQLAGQGIPIFALLAKKFGVTGAQLRKGVEAGALGFDAFNQVLKELSMKGGMAFGLMDAQAKTFFGGITKIIEAMEILGMEVGKIIMDTFNVQGGLDGVRKVLLLIEKKLEVFKRVHPQLLKFLVIFLGFLAVLGPILVGVGFLGVAIGGLGVIAGLAFAPIFLVAGVIAGIIAAVLLLARYMHQIKAVSSSTKNIFKGIFKLVTDIVMAPMTASTQGFGATIKRIRGDLESLFSSFKRLFHFTGLTGSLRIVLHLVLRISEAVAKWDKLMSKFRAKVSTPAEGMKSLLAKVSGSAVAPAGAPGSFVPPGFQKAQQFFTGVFGAPAQAKAHVTVHIRDRGDNVQAVESKTVGDMGLNVGKNMAGAT